MTEICQRIAVSKECFYRWRKKFCGPQVSEARRLRQLGDEELQLKPIAAGQELDLKVLKDVAGRAC